MRQSHVSRLHTPRIVSILKLLFTRNLILYQLRSSVADILLRLTGASKVPVALLSHCRRLVMQQVWRILLDDQFVHAWVHGVELICGDGVARRIYPRIFTYSADYPEK